MTWDMTGVRAKLDRVEANLESYKFELGRYVQANPYVIVPKFDVESGCHDIFVRIEPPSPVFGLIVGEGIHNLRSALDHLAWQLANVDGPPPDPDRVLFPIYSTEPKAFLKLNRLNGMREPQKAVLEHLQPYKFTDRPIVLEMLSWLSNTDKHRLLHTTASSGVQFVPHFIEARDGYVLESSEFGYKGILEGETKIGRVLVTPISDELQVNMQIHPLIGISFSEAGTPVAGYAVDGFLKTLKEVVEGIVTVFNRPGQNGFPPWP